MNTCIHRSTTHNQGKLSSEKMPKLESTSKLSQYIVQELENLSQDDKVEEIVRRLQFVPPQFIQSTMFRCSRLIRTLYEQNMRPLYSAYMEKNWEEVAPAEAIAGIAIVSDDVTVGPNIQLRDIEYFEILSGNHRTCARISARMPILAQFVVLKRSLYEPIRVRLSTRLETVQPRPSSANIWDEIVLINRIDAEVARGINRDLTGSYGKSVPEGLGTWSSVRRAYFGRELSTKLAKNRVQNDACLFIPKKGKAFRMARALYWSGLLEYVSQNQVKHGWEWSRKVMDRVKGDTVDSIKNMVRLADRYKLWEMENFQFCEEYIEQQALRIQQIEDEQAKRREEERKAKQRKKNLKRKRKANSSKSTSSKRSKRTDTRSNDEIHTEKDESSVTISSQETPASTERQSTAGKQPLTSTDIASRSGKASVTAVPGPSKNPTVTKVQPQGEESGNAPESQKTKSEGSHSVQNRGKKAETNQTEQPKAYMDVEDDSIRAVVQSSGSKGQDGVVSSESKLEISQKEHLRPKTSLISVEAGMQGAGDGLMKTSDGDEKQSNIPLSFRDMHLHVGFLNKYHQTRSVPIQEEERTRLDVFSSLELIHLACNHVIKWTEDSKNKVLVVQDPMLNVLPLRMFLVKDMTEPYYPLHEGRATGAIARKEREDIWNSEVLVVPMRIPGNTENIKYADEFGISGNHFIALVLRLTDFRKEVLQQGKEAWDHPETWGGIDVFVHDSSCKEDLSTRTLTSWYRFAFHVVCRILYGKIDFPTDRKKVVRVIKRIVNIPCVKTLGLQQTDGTSCGWHVVRCVESLTRNARNIEHLRELSTRNTGKKKRPYTSVLAFRDNLAYTSIKDITRRTRHAFWLFKYMNEEKLPQSIYPLGCTPDFDVYKVLTGEHEAKFKKYLDENLSSGSISTERTVSDEDPDNVTTEEATTKASGSEPKAEEDQSTVIAKLRDEVEQLKEQLKKAKLDEQPRTRSSKRGLFKKLKATELTDDDISNMRRLLKEREELDRKKRS